jgi:hypothetical protein
MFDSFIYGHAMIKETILIKTYLKMLPLLLKHDGTVAPCGSPFLLLEVSFIWLRVCSWHLSSLIVSFQCVEWQGHVRRMSMARSSFVHLALLLHVLIILEFLLEGVLFDCRSCLWHSFSSSGILVSMSYVFLMHGCWSSCVLLLLYVSSS